MFYFESQISRYSEISETNLWEGNLAGQEKIKKIKNSPKLNVAVSIQISLSQNVLLVFPKNPNIFLQSQNFTTRIAACVIYKFEAKQMSKEKVKWQQWHLHAS